MAIPAALVTQTKRVQISASSAAIRTARKALPDLSKLDQQAAGGVIRAVTSSTLDQFGNVATQAARISYDQMRATVPLAKFTAVTIKPKIDQVLDPVVGRAMSLYTQERFVDTESALFDAIGRVVGDIFRETIVSNSDLDQYASGYQRVASADACAFCMTVALNEYTSYEESGGYHDNCSCTTVPVFRGFGAYRPSYYDQFEQDYTDATSAVGGDTADVLSRIRANTSRR